MPGTGRSVIGQLQNESIATADNLNQTSETVREMKPGLEKIWDHMQTAMGDTHQDDVPKLEEVVNEARQALDECADILTECAQKIRELEANT